MTVQASFPYDTRILMGVVQGKEFKTPGYLRDTFFPNVMCSSAKFIAFDKLPDGDRALAPFVNRRIGGKRIELQGYETQMYTPPVVGNHFTVTPEDLFNRAPGHTEYDLNGPRAYLDHQVKTGLRRIENMITRREEWMCAQTLVKGEIVIKGDGVSDKVQFWSHLDEAEQPKSEVKNSWANADVKPLDIIKDLSAVTDTIVERSGLMPTKLICGRAVYNALLEKFIESKMLDMRNVNMGGIDPKNQPNGIRSLGFLAEPGLEIVSYVDRYNDGEGNVLPMIPDDVCLFVSPEIHTIMAYGAIANGWTANGAPNLMTGTRFSFERPHDSLEQGRSIFLQASPLPILQSTDGFHVLKAIV